jgi:hypothetical protein
MKKYIQPETIIVKLHTISMIATTGGLNGRRPGNGYNSSDVTYSRDRGDWDDENDW